MVTAGLVTKEQIVENKKKLLNAFQNCDLKTLDELLHDGVRFVIPNGELLDKNTVLENYRKGNSAFSTIRVSDQAIQLTNDTAVVTMIMDMEGKYHEQFINKKFRYIRVWQTIDNTLKVIAVSGVQLGS